MSNAAEINKDIDPTDLENAIKVNKKRVACDGGGGALGHPKVYLDMGQCNSVRCKYCDRLFLYAPA